MVEGDDFDPMREKRDSDPAEPCTPGSIIRRGCQRCFCNELGQTNKCNSDACRNTTKTNAGKFINVMWGKDVTVKFLLTNEHISE